MGSHDQITAIIFGCGDFGEEIPLWVGSRWGHLKKVNVGSGKVQSDHGIKFDGSEISCFEFAVNENEHLLWIGGGLGRILMYDTAKGCDLMGFGVGQEFVERVLEILICNSEKFLFIRSSGRADPSYLDNNEKFSLGEGGPGDGDGDQEINFLRKWNVKDGHEEVDMHQEW